LSFLILYFRHHLVYILILPLLNDDINAIPLSEEFPLDHGQHVAIGFLPRLNILISIEYELNTVVVETVSFGFTLRLDFSCEF